MSKRRRQSPIPRIRWNLTYIRRLAIEEDSFISEFGLKPHCFDWLCGLLRESLEVDSTKASAASPVSSPIPIESRIASTLIELRGGRRLETMRTIGIVRSTAYATFRKVIRAIKEHPLLEISCDMSLASQTERAKGFEAMSTARIFRFCDGAVDGLALSIIAPPKSKHINQTQFHSGSKKKNCVNLQGVCDSKLRFIAVSCQHTGCTNDAEAFESSSLRDICRLHIFPYH